MEKQRSFYQEKQAKRNKSNFWCVCNIFSGKKSGYFRVSTFILNHFPVNPFQWHFLGFLKSIT